MPHFVGLHALQALAVGIGGARDLGTLVELGAGLDQVERFEGLCVELGVHAPHELAAPHHLVAR